MNPMDLQSIVAGARGGGFAEVGPCQPQGDAADHEERPEPGLPAEDRGKPAADRRAHHRGHGHAHGDIADHRGGLGLGDHVAHHGARQDERRDDRRLEHAEDEEHGRTGGEDAAQRGQEEDRHPRQQHRPAPDPVGDGTDEKLQHRVDAEIEGDGKLHDPVLCAEIRGHRRERGQEDVHRQSRQGRQGDQRQDMGGRGSVEEPARGRGDRVRRCSRSRGPGGEFGHARTLTRRAAVSISPDA